MSSSTRAGVGKVDITPPMGIQIAGDIGRPRPTEEIRDPIFAKALVVEDDASAVCVLVMDILAITNKMAGRIRERAAAQYGLDPLAIMVHVTQTHSAPSIGHFFCRDENPAIAPEDECLRGGDSRYDDQAIDGAIAAIGQAMEDRRPVRIGGARSVDARWGHNRRFVQRDGTASTHAKGGVDNILRTEGPQDPEVAVLRISDMDDKPIAVLLHYTCHPTHGYPKHYISADWCGVWADAIEAEFPGAVGLVVNGCCGNVAPNRHLCPEARPADHQQLMGEGLAESSLRVMRRISNQAECPVSWHHQQLAIPYRNLTPEELAWSENVMAEHPTPWYRENEPEAVEWDWLYAIGRLEVHEMGAAGETYPYEVQGFRFGGIGLLGLIGEPFVEAQLEIKRRSPAGLTLVAHMCNGYVGYIPTRRALLTGGYETRTGAGSKLAPDALEHIAETSCTVLGRLFQTVPGPARAPTDLRL